MFRNIKVIKCIPNANLYSQSVDATLYLPSILHVYPCSGFARSAGAWGFMLLRCVQATVTPDGLRLWWSKQAH